MQVATDTVQPPRPFFLRTAALAPRQPVPPDNEIQRARRQEREHLARELHDVLSGELVAARLQLASLRSRLGDQGAEVETRLQDLDRSLLAALAVKRQIIDGLAPQALQRHGLASSLQSLVRGFAEHSHIRMHDDLDTVTADADVQLAVYRLVQESLTNIAKYAGATEGDVVLRDRGAELSVFVRDNGLGFDPQRPGALGHGLAGMRHRIEGARGHLTVESAPGQGTRIAATLPKRAAP